jgi:hypothetical protein
MPPPSCLPKKLTDVNFSSLIGRRLFPLHPVDFLLQRPGGRLEPKVAAAGRKATPWQPKEEMKSSVSKLAHVM